MDIQKIANTIARGNGKGRATSIRFNPAITAPKIKHTSYGYRKYTTGEYVPNAYLKNFGWKNTYYQQAETEVSFPLWMGWLAGEDL